MASASRRDGGTLREALRIQQSLMGETPYSPSPKGDATRTGILRQALASPFGRS
ncbi:MAG: hypothetical protein V7K49_06970 [Nostoc sp.]